MRLNDLTNPEAIAFLSQCQRKEVNDRLNWIIKHEDLIHKAATLKREPTNYEEIDIIANCMKKGMVTVTIDHHLARGNRRKPAIKDKDTISVKKFDRILPPGVKEAKAEIDLPVRKMMRPVDPNVKKIIYKSAPEFGRRQYLNKRIRVIPEAKYYYPECTSWVHGWRLDENPYCELRKHAIVWQLKRCLENRSGAQPDPSHYSSTAISGNTKCTF